MSTILNSQKKGEDGLGKHNVLSSGGKGIVSILIIFLLQALL